MTVGNVARNVAIRGALGEGGAPLEMLAAKASRDVGASARGEQREPRQSDPGVEPRRQTATQLRSPAPSRITTG